MSEPVNKDLQELRNTLRIEQLSKEIIRLEKGQTKQHDANTLAHETYRDELTQLNTKIAEKEKNNTSSRDILVKVVPWALAVGLGLFSYSVSDKLDRLEEWRASHEQVIENRDTVQCSSIQAGQVAYNNTHPENQMKVIECGVGAGF